MDEKLYELNGTKMHEKVFSGDKFLAAKFVAAKKIAVKMSCGENSGDETSRGEIVMRLKFW